MIDTAFCAEGTGLLIRWTSTISSPDPTERKAKNTAFTYISAITDATFSAKVPYTKTRGRCGGCRGMAS